jgi:hypothetical protein
VLRPGDLYASPSLVALGSRTTFRRDKRSLLITLRVLDARLIAGITGINARPLADVWNVYFAEQTHARRRGTRVIINFDNGKISLCRYSANGEM